MKMELRLKISDEIGRTFMPLHVQLLKPKIAVTFSKEGRKNKLFFVYNHCRDYRDKHSSRLRTCVKYMR